MLKNVKYFNLPAYEFVFLFQKIDTDQKILISSVKVVIFSSNQSKKNCYNYLKQIVKTTVAFLPQQFRIIRFTSDTSANKIVLIFSRIFIFIFFDKTLLYFCPTKKHLEKLAVGVALALFLN